MRRSLLICTAIAVIFSSGVPARADKFTFTFSGSGFSGSGFLFGSPDPFASGAFDIASATGTINGSSIAIAAGSMSNSSRAVADPSGKFLVDDVIYLNGSHGNLGGDYASFLDNEGLLFADASSTLYNVYSGGGDQVLDSPGNYPNSVPVTFEIATTPEPSSLALLGTGILATVGVAGMFRRRTSNPRYLRGWLD